MTRRAAQMKYVRSCECYAIMAIRSHHLENAAIFNEGAGKAMEEFGLASVLRPTYAKAEIQTETRRR